MNALYASILSVKILLIHENFPLEKIVLYRNCIAVWTTCDTDDRKYNPLST